jgi:Kinesin motor domain
MCPRLHTASSRSHCIIILHVERGSARTSHSRLMLCDLAGSERQKSVRPSACSAFGLQGFQPLRTPLLPLTWHLHFGIDCSQCMQTITILASMTCVRMPQTAAEGLALEEGKQINRSLSALSNVVQTLTGAALVSHGCTVCF